MISRLTGTLYSKSPTEIALDVHGVGFSLHIPISTFEKLGEIGSTAALLTHLHVREDAMVLFGFYSEAEREIFRMLISVSGIGPKTALGILSGIQPGEFIKLISEGNSDSLTAIPGIGKKTAERLVVELRDKAGKLSTDSFPVTPSSSEGSLKSEALSAMISLGFSRPSAENAIRIAFAGMKENPATVQELLKVALKSAVK